MNEITRYVQANAELEAAKRAVFDIARCLNEFARYLERRPAEVAFYNLDGRPPRSDGSQLQWDAAAAPTPATVQEALDRRRRAAEDALAAWASVPEEHRQSLVAPRV